MFSSPCPGSDFPIHEGREQGGPCTWEAGSQAVPPAPMHATGGVSPQVASRARTHEHPLPPLLGTAKITQTPSSQASNKEHLLASKLNPAGWKPLAGAKRDKPSAATRRARNTRQPSASRLRAQVIICVHVNAARRQREGSGDAVWFAASPLRALRRLPWFCCSFPHRQQEIRESPRAWKIPALLAALLQLRLLGSTGIFFSAKILQLEL